MRLPTVYFAEATIRAAISVIRRLAPPLREQREARRYVRRRSCLILTERAISGAAQDCYFEAIPSRSILWLRASTNSMLRRRYSLYVSRS